MNELKQIINHFTEKEAKSLLSLLFTRIQTFEEIERYTEKQFAIDMKKMYHDLLDFQKNKEITNRHKPSKATHIVFGDSAAGSLNMALQGLGLHNQEQIINFFRFIFNRPNLAFT